MLSHSGLFHIHMHARLTARHADTTDAARATKVQQAKVSREGLTAIIDSLHGAVKKLRWMKQSEWSNYYDENSYTESSFDAKGRLVRGYLQRIAPTSVWALGANTGGFSRIATELVAAAVAFDLIRRPSS